MPGSFPEENSSLTQKQRQDKSTLDTYNENQSLKIPSPIAMDNGRELGRAKGNRAINAALINPDIDPQNVLSTRTRSSKNFSQFAQYNLAFS